MTPARPSLASRTRSRALDRFDYEAAHAEVERDERLMQLRVEDADDDSSRAMWRRDLERVEEL